MFGETLLPFWELLFLLAGRCGYDDCRVVFLQPRIDQDHPRWLHLRIRSPNQPSPDAGRLGIHGSARVKRLVDGRWTLAFPDEAACAAAMLAVTEELAIQRVAVEQVLRPLLGAEILPVGACTDVADVTVGDGAIEVC